MNTKLQNIDHIHVFVTNRQEALVWYSNILGLKPLEKLISLPKSGPLTIRNDEDTITIALFKGTPQDNRTVIAFKVSGEEFINYHDIINKSKTENIDLVDHNSQFSIYFDDPYGNPYEITSYDYKMLSNYYNT